ncbi:GNAT family N-acetyltransferase [Ktedonobacter racemifer]|uniref:GCN5-related N-acetyltransferase n=1 Tax=Ktedonobacter racemifer DSM 44963 TaxID=485913 RepID=D6TLX8_KTERA|nr:GNAT family N-acetyltransferase [Ktedonobacter racemifer]EFH86778.1 GCN5-related N-acetyltransferase [Ktedonobacter racemifer DSM 44963]
MIITTYMQASDFLERARAELERNEVLNGLPLGIALRLQKSPERIEVPPYLATVEDEVKLIVAAVMTPPFRLIVTSNQFDAFGEALSLLIHNLREHGWPVPGVIGPSSLSDLFAQTWTSLTGEASHLRTHQRLFELTQVIAPRPGLGSLRIATPADTVLVVRWIKAFQEEALHTSISDEEALAWARTRIGNSEVYLWVLPDETIVSLVATSRPISRVISIGPVYTPPELRGHGYASRSVAALSQHLLDSGWERCSLFTDLSNPTSNSIYQQVGYRPVCDFNEYVFSHK